MWRRCSGKWWKIAVTGKRRWRKVATSFFSLAPGLKDDLLIVCECCERVETLSLIASSSGKLLNGERRMTRGKEVKGAAKWCRVVFVFVRSNAMAASRFEFEVITGAAQGKGRGEVRDVWER
jgi:hypothetical protein